MPRREEGLHGRVWAGQSGHPTAWGSMTRGRRALQWDQLGSRLWGIGARASGHPDLQVWEGHAELWGQRS